MSVHWIAGDIEAIIERKKRDGERERLEDR